MYVNRSVYIIHTLSYSIIRYSIMHHSSIHTVEYDTIHKHMHPMNVHTRLHAFVYYSFML